MKMKSKGSFTLVPFGGLANRMYAMASAYCTCRANGSRLDVVWFREWGMKADFGDIFEPWADDSNATVRGGQPMGQGGERTSAQAQFVCSQAHATHRLRQADI